MTNKKETWGGIYTFGSRIQGLRFQIKRGKEPVTRKRFPGAVDQFSAHLSIRVLLILCMCFVSAFFFFFLLLESTSPLSPSTSPLPPYIAPLNGCQLCYTAKVLFLPPSKALFSGFVPYAKTQKPSISRHRYRRAPPIRHRPFFLSRFGGPCRAPGPSKNARTFTVGVDPPLFCFSILDPLLLLLPSPRCSGNKGWRRGITPGEVAVDIRVTVNGGVTCGVRVTTPLG